MSGEKRICAECANELFLRKLIRNGSNAATGCDYCGRVRKTISVADLALECERVISTYFDPTDSEDAVVIYDRPPRGSDLEEVLDEILGASTAVVSDVAEALGDNWFDWSSHESQYGDDPHFVRRSSGLAQVHSTEWRSMERSLRGEARHFNPRAVSILQKVFGPILNDRTRRGSGVVLAIGPETKQKVIYRARVFHSLEDMEAALLHPAREVGPPPSGIARAGRMNAKGVSVFYGSTVADTAVAEVRPPVGSHVLVGEFRLARRLKVLDLDRLEDIALHPKASLFDPATEAMVDRNEFLELLSRRMVMPVMPDNEDNGYLTTQAIADFLATHPKLQLDGIMFRSVQFQSPHDGRNIILFNKASRVADSEPGAGGRIGHVQLFESDEEGDHWEPEISVKHPDDWTKIPFWPLEIDDRVVALEINLENLCISDIKGVSVTSKVTEVRKRDAPKQQFARKIGIRER